ncbi:DUF397 domain-containing protein [Streptomyces durmitorensis]|uniref:DUF397 domain-containing protein n=1 Tax=Streptomyces durmitorensis TaxID=319947 RepID=A0ABY4PXV3_9ACTN|nr:DUF397 domain-containing protein [Streptomyces durmitorensis]UQT58280.1 DUF397 domain-containing protein [Streptomyces durmitorensis]
MIRKASAGDTSELNWFKSSYSSSSDPNDCVEVALEWHKSSYSDSSNGEDCVEVAPTPATIHIRDSKNTLGPQLAVTPAAWGDFVTYASES